MVSEKYTTLFSKQFAEETNEECQFDSVACSHNFFFFCFVHFPMCVARSKQMALVPETSPTVVKSSFSSTPDARYIKKGSDDPRAPNYVQVSKPPKSITPTCRSASSPAASLRILKQSSVSTGPSFLFCVVAETQITERRSVTEVLLRPSLNAFLFLFCFFVQVGASASSATAASSATCAP